MSETTTMALIIAATILLVIFILRDKIKIFKVKGGGMSAEVGTHSTSPKVGTHEPDRLVVKGVEQNAAEGSNNAAIHSNNATVDGFKQTAKKGNDLVIGNPEP